MRKYDDLDSCKIKVITQGSSNHKWLFGQMVRLVEELDLEMKKALLFCAAERLGREVCSGEIAHRLSLKHIAKPRVDVWFLDGRPLIEFEPVDAYFSNMGRPSFLRLYMQGYLVTRWRRIS